MDLDVTDNWFLPKAHSCNFRSWSPWTVPIVVGILQRINTLFDNLLCVLLLDWKCEKQILSFPFVIFILWLYNLNHSFTYLLFFSICPLKAPSEPPPFSMPSKWLTLYGKAKSYCLTTSCGPESMFNYCFTVISFVSTCCEWNIITKLSHGQKTKVWLTRAL